MKIEINDTRKISEIQEEFSRIFPYLKIDFYKILNSNGDEHMKNSNVSQNKTLQQFSSLQNNPEIIITPQTTVIDLVLQFFTIYGLQVQIFRKSGKAWLETTITDSWTLLKQNEQGEDLSKEVA